MSGILPIIEILADADGREEAAHWLQRCPVAVIAVHHQAIRDILIKKQFPEAVLCLDAELTLALSVREPNGAFHRRPEAKVRQARKKMRMAAWGRKRSRGE